MNARGWGLGILLCTWVAVVTAGSCDDCQGSDSGSICCLTDGSGTLAPGCVATSSECRLASEGLLVIPTSPEPQTVGNPLLRKPLRGSAQVKWFTETKPLFETLPSKDSVDQGHLGDCWLISTVGAVASTQWGPQYLQSIMRHRGGSVYTKLFSCEDADLCKCDHAECMVPSSAFTPRMVGVKYSLPRAEDGSLINYAFPDAVPGKAIQSFAHRGLFVSFIEKAAAAAFSPFGDKRNTFKLSSAARAHLENLDGGAAPAAFGLLFGVGEIQSVLDDKEKQNREEHATMKKFFFYKECMELTGNQERFCKEVRTLPQFSDQYDPKPSRATNFDRLMHPCYGTIVRFKFKGGHWWRLGYSTTEWSKWASLCQVWSGSDAPKECNETQKRIIPQAMWQEKLEKVEFERLGDCKRTDVDITRRAFDNTYSYRRLESQDIGRLWETTASDDLSDEQKRTTLHHMLVESGLPGFTPGLSQKRYRYWKYQQEALDKMLEWSENDLPIVAWTKRVFREAGKTWGGREGVPVRFNPSAATDRVGDSVGGRDDDDVQWHTFSTGIAKSERSRGYVVGNHHQMFVTAITRNDVTNEFRITVHNPYGWQTYDSANNKWLKFKQKYLMRDSYTLGALQFFRMFYRVFTCEECKEVALSHIAATTEAEWSSLKQSAPFPPGAIFMCTEQDGSRLQWRVKDWAGDEHFVMENVSGEKRDRSINTTTRFKLVQRYCDRVTDFPG